MTWSSLVVEGLKLEKIKRDNFGIKKFQYIQNPLKSTLGKKKYGQY